MARARPPRPASPDPRRPLPAGVSAQQKAPSYIPLPAHAPTPDRLRTPAERMLVPAALASLLLLLVVSWAPLAAQSAAAVADTSPFRRLELPTPGATRTASGQPGRGYWQQRADYVI